MKCFVLLLLPLPAFGWWCETSDRHGCRGQSRHFVREAAVANPFLVFEDIKIYFFQEPIVVDWDGDGDLDVILRKPDGLSLFEFKSGKHFVEVSPNPFHGIPGGRCRPAVVDWNGDGLLDLIVGIQDLTQQCQVDAEKAKASVQADADAIKERIQKEHQSFEYVNQTVEQALWCEVIKFLKQSQQEPEEIELSTETPQDLDLSASSAPVSAMLSADSQCGLQ